METKTVVGIETKRKKRFADFADEPGILDGDKVQIERVLNTEIEVIGYRIKPSKFTKNISGQCLTLQFINMDGERRIIFTGSDVLIEQIKRYGEQVPFFTIIKKVDRYYTMS